jgi:hypothetical protein
MLKCIYVHFVIYSIHVHVAMWSCIHMHLAVCPCAEFSFMLWAREKKLVMHHGSQGRFGYASWAIAQNLLKSHWPWCKAIDQGAESREPLYLKAFRILYRNNGAKIVHVEITLPKA